MCPTSSPSFFRSQSMIRMYGYVSFSCTLSYNIFCCSSSSGPVGGAQIHQNRRREVRTAVPNESSCSYHGNKFCSLSVAVTWNKHKKKQKLVTRFIAEQWDRDAEETLRTSKVNRLTIGWTLLLLLLWDVRGRRSGVGGGAMTPQGFIVQMCRRGRSIRIFSKKSFPDPFGPWAEWWRMCVYTTVSMVTSSSACCCHAMNLPAVGQ